MACIDVQKMSLSTRVVVLGQTEGLYGLVEQFVPDWVAIGAMKEVLSKAGIDEDATDVKERMAAIGRRVRCETCEDKIIVPLPDVVCFSISQCVKD